MDCRVEAVLHLRVLPSFGRKTQLGAEDRNRLECYVLIARLRDRGLGEAVKSLRDMVEFYVEEPPLTLPPSPVRSVQAKVGRSYTSTVPPFAEE